MEERAALRFTPCSQVSPRLSSAGRLASAPCAPATLETLARFSVMSRLRKHDDAVLREVDSSDAVVKEHLASPRRVAAAD